MSDIFKNLEVKEKNFLYARNFLRFWNYNLADENQRNFIFELIENSKKIVKQFTHIQEIIYKSCGMPINFKIAFSCAFKTAHQNLSEISYERIEIIKDSLEKIKKELDNREKLCSILDCNRVSVYRKNNVPVKQIIKEIFNIFKDYNIEFLTYNFKELRKDLSLNLFLK